MQLLRMDLQAAEGRVRVAEGKVGDLQAQLQVGSCICVYRRCSPCKCETALVRCVSSQAVAAGTAEDMGSLRQQVLDLELQLEAQRDREQVSLSEVWTRASAQNMDPSRPKAAVTDAYCAARGVLLCP